MSTNTAQDNTYPNGVNPSQELLSVSDAARILRISSSTLRNYEKEGRVESVREDNGYRKFKLSEIKKLKHELEEEKVIREKERELAKQRRKEKYSKSTNADISLKNVLENKSDTNTSEGHKSTDDKVSYDPSSKGELHNSNQKDVNGYDKNSEVQNAVFIGNLLRNPKNYKAPLFDQKLNKKFMGVVLLLFAITSLGGLAISKLVDNGSDQLTAEINSSAATAQAQNIVGPLPQVLGYNVKAGGNYEIVFHLATNFINAATFQEIVTMENDLQVSGNTNMDGTLNVNSLATLAGGIETPTLVFTGAGTISGLNGIDETTESTLELALDIAGDVISVDDNGLTLVRLADEIDYDGNLTINGIINIAGEFQLDGEEITVTADELNILSGLSATSGGIYFSDGNTFAQDAVNFFWNDTSNRLGIGTDNPATALHVMGTVTATGFTMTTGAVNGYVLTTDASGQASWQAVAQSPWSQSGNNIYPTDLSNNVGVGTSSPTALFSVGTNSAFTVDANGNVTLADGAILDLSNISHSTNSVQGLRLPQNTALTNIAGGSEGYIAYDTTSNEVLVFDGVSWNNISGASTSLQQAYENGNTIELNAVEGDIRIFNDSGDEALFLEETSGNVGIGTTAPGEKLSVDGRILLFPTSAPGTTTNKLYNVGGSLFWNGVDLSSSGGLFTDGGATTYLTSLTDNFALGGTDNTSPFFFDNANERLVLTSTGAGIIFRVNDSVGDPTPFVINGDGNVGIGTTGPTFKLDVNGDIRIASGSDLYIGTIGLNDVGVNNTTSGATLIGVFDEFDNSNSTSLQAVLNDLDAAIGAASSKWTDSGSFTYLNSLTDDLAIGGSTPGTAAFYFDVSTGNIMFEGSTANAFETTLVITDPTADRTITLPNADGEISLLGQSIQGSEIEDGTIEEVDLEVTNAPSDNFILTYDQATGGFTWVDPATAGTNYWQRNGTDLAPLNIGDNVGIGTTAPGNKLHVYANTTGALDAAGGSMLILEQDGTGDAGIQFALTGGQIWSLGVDNSTANDDFVLFDGNAARLTIDGSSGNLTVAQGLNVNGNTVFGDNVADTVTSTSGAWTFSNATTINLANSQTQALNFENGLLNLDTNNSRIGIGTTTPGYTLDVNGDIRIAAGSDLYIGTIGLNDTGTDNTNSGGSRIGVFDEFTYSNATTVQDVLDDLDQAITDNDYFDDSSTAIYLANLTRDFAIGGSEPTNSAFYFDTSTGNIIFEGATANGFETTLVLTDPTADRTITIPNADGEISLLGQSIQGSEIEDGTIEEVDLEVTNAASDNFILTYDQATGGFTWVDPNTVGTNYWTDAGGVTYLTSLTDDLAFGGSAPDNSAFYFDVSTGNITFEGATANGFETTLVLTDPTADRTITIPNADGEISLLGQSIQGSEIEDGTIEEVDLEVTNAPSDNFMLTYDQATGGFTWIDPATAGTNYWQRNGTDLAPLNIGDNVGIGTTAPDNKLHVYANTTGALDAAGGSMLILEQDGTGDAGIQFALTGGQIWSLGVDNSTANDDFVLFDGNTARLTIDGSSGNLTVAQDLTVNGGDLTTSQATFNLLNTTATTINFGGGASLIDIGAGTSTVSINDALAIDGNTTLGNAAGDTVTSNAGAWTFSNATTINLANAQAQALNFESGLLVLDTSNNRIGIGTTAPGYTLDVNGDARIASGSDLYIGTIGLGDTGANNTTSGASLIGVFDEFNNSNGTTVQQVLNDLDSAIGAGGSKWTDTGALTYLTSLTDNLAIGGSTPTTAAFFFDVSTGNIVFEGATANGFETTLVLTDPTADRTITIPNADGEISLLGQSIQGSEIEDGTIEEVDLEVTNAASDNFILTYDQATGGFTWVDPDSVGTNYWQRNGTDLAPLNIGDNVGIGTTAPDNKLHVYANTTGALDAAGGSMLILEQDGTGDAGIQFALTGGQIWSLGVDNSTANDDFVLFDGNSARLTIDGSSGNLTVAQDLAINGGDITTTQATFNLLNDTATTINFGGGASLIDIGAGTSTVSINDALTIDGNTTLGNASGDTVTSNAGAWTFSNATTINLANAQTQALNFEGGLLNLDTSNSRIGIGTTAPAYKLDVNGDIRIASGSDLYIGTIGLNDVGANNVTSGASLIGVFDEFTNSNGTTVQQVLNDLDDAIGAGSSKWTDAGAFTYLTHLTDDLAIGGSTPGTAAFYFDVSTGNIVFEGATANGFETTLVLTDPTADRTITIPNADGEISLLGQSIQGSEIEDGTIEEVDLEVTNAPSDNFILTYDQATGGFTWVDPATAGTNYWTDAGNVTYLTSLTDDLALGGSSPDNSAFYFDVSTGNIVFEGATANGFETTLVLTDPTADRTITIPNADGEISLLGQSIQGSEIEDGTIEEVDLEVTNAPSDNFILTYDQATGGFTWVDPATAGTNYWQRNGTDIAPLNIGDNVGIGTTAPEYKLDVAGDIRIANGSDLYIGTIGLNDIGTNNTNSGASRIGVFDEFDHSSSTTVQDVLDDLDAAISANDFFDDSGTAVYLSNLTRDFAIGGSEPTNSAFYFDTSTGNIIFEGATANGFETTLVLTDPTADRTITIPNADGEISLLGQTIAGSEIEADTLDFSHFIDAMTVDATTSINLHNGASDVDLRFYNSDSGRDYLFFDGSADFIGIGHTTPQNLLHVLTNTTSTINSANGSALIIEQSGTGDAGIQFELTGGQLWSLGIDNSTANDDFVIFDGASARLTIDGSSGNVIVAQNLDIRGTSITTDQANFDLINTDATTINFGGAATTVNIGSGTSTVNFGNAIDVSGNATIDGNTTLGNASVDSVISNADNWSFVNATTINLANAQAQALNFEGGLLNLDTSNSRIGIGTTAPAYKLDVNGDIRIASGSDLYIGTIGLNDVGANNTTSGASLIGVFDEFTNSNGTTVQQVLNDLDDAIGAGSSKWTDAGAFTYLTHLTDDLAIGGSTPDTAAFYFDVSTGNIVFEGATANGFETTLVLTDPTADRTITIPNADGEISLLGQSIQGSEIEDGTIEEVDLEVTNAASDNFVLTYDQATGGFTWVDPDTVGTNYWQRNGTDLAPLNIGDNVGIGTTAPDNKLHVYANTTGALDVAGGSMLLLEQDGTGDAGIQFALTGGQIFSLGIDNSSGNDDFILFDGNTARLTIDGTSGNLTVAQDLAVNGGDLTTSQATFNLLNATATTINFGGGASLIDIGAGTSTVSINDALTIDGNTTLGNASGDTVTSNAGAWTFSNATTVNLANAQTQALNFENGLLNLDTSNSRIGIGTTAPAYKLDVNGDIRIASGSDLYIGTIGLNDVGANNTTSGATLVGVFDEFNNSNGTTVQQVLKDLDSAIGAGGSKWTDTGAFTYLTSLTDDLALGGSTPSTAAFYFDVSTGNITFEGATANGFETTLVLTDPTADRTITIPNADGEISLLGQSIQGSEIEDGTIEEVDLEVTNAASDNFILTYDQATGGFTWVDPDTVGTNYWQRNGTDLAPLNIGDNVGIGTTAPDNKLHVYANTTGALDVAGGSMLILEQDGTGDAGIQFALTGGQIWSIGIDNSTANDDFVLFDGNTARLTIDGSSGNLTIAQGLNVNGNTVFGDNAADTVTSTSGAWTFTNATTVNLANSQTQALNFESGLLVLDTNNSRIGIGTTAPAYKLDVNGDIRIASGSDLYIGTIGLNDVGSNNTTSGASRIGIFDEFDHSNSTTVQDVLDDLDAAITSIDYFNDSGTAIYLSNLTRDFAIGGSEPTNSAFYFDTSTGNIIFEGATANGFETTLVLTDPTADRTITIPNADGEISLLGQSIQGSEIEDGTIEEVDLEVTNAPSDNYILTYDQATGGFTWVDPGTAGTNYWQRNGTDLAPLNIGDNVGIGTTAPGNKLHVYANTTGALDVAGGSMLILEQDGTGDAGIQFALTGGQIWSLGVDNSTTNDDFVLFDGNTARLTIDGSSGNLTVAQDLAVNGGDITTSQATFNLLNSTATTINFGGGASLIDMGAGTSTVSINDALTVDGNTTLGNASGDSVTSNAATWVFSNATSIDLANAQADALNFESGLFTLDTANSRVGIGAVDVDERFHVSMGVDGDAVLGLFENSQANAASSTNETAQIRFGFGGDNDVARIVAGKVNDYTNGANSDSFLAFYTDLNGTATEAMRINENGNLGIGTTNPQYKLDVNGDIRIALGSDLYVGAIGLNDVGSNNTTSGASLIGVFDEFDNSNATTVQDVLDDLDAAISAGSSKWTDAGTFTYLTNLTDDLAIGGSTPDTSAFYFDVSTGNIVFEGATANGFETTLVLTDPTADRTITIPNADGEISLLGQSIQGSEIEDGTIEEVDLEVTNAPSDNFVLTYDQATGGFTWVDPDTVGVNYWQRNGTDLAPLNIGDNVGIGTTAPGNKLHVYANTTGALDAAGGSMLILEQDGTGDAGIQFALTGGQVWSLGVDNSTTNDDFVLFDGNTARLTIDGSSGNLTVAQDLAVNGGDITTSQATFNLLNTTATTINFGGGASLIDIGAGTSTVSINDALAIDGNTTLGNASGDSVTSNAASWNFTNATTINLANAQTQALNFESGLMVFDTNNSRIGIGTTAPAYKLDVNGDVRIASGSDLYIGTIGLNDTGTNNTDSGASRIGVFDEFDHSNATTIQDVLDDLDAAISATDYFDDSGTAIYLSNLTRDFAIGGSEPTNSAFYFDTSTGNIIFEGATANGFETTLVLTDPTADRTITIPNADGEISLLGQSIQGSEIEDGTIEEVDLEVTNAPSDNFVLTYDQATGGFTWVDPDTVGTNYWQRNGTDLAPLNVGDNIGIGTTAPDNKLHVYANTTGALDVAGGSMLILEQDGTGDAGIQFALTGGQIWSLGVDNSTTNDDFVLFDGNTARLTVDGSSGNLTVAQDLAVNGGDITTSQATFNLLNATATTINFGGGASLIDIGAGTSTVSINDALTIDGNTTLGNASGDSVTSNAASWIFANASTVDLANSQVNALNFESNLLNLDTQNTRVGIGTGAPAALFSVGGSSQFRVDGSGNVTLADGALLDLSNIVHDDTAPQGLRLPQGASLANPSAGEGYLAWDTDGSLHVYDGAAWLAITTGASTLSLQNAYIGGNTVQLSAGEGDIRFYNDSGSEMLFLDESSGFLGVGTTAPQGQFHIDSVTGGNLTIGRNDTVVSGNDEVGRIDFYSNDSTHGGVRAFIKAIANSNASSSSWARLELGNDSNNTIMTLRDTASGPPQVGVGTTDPQAEMHLNSGASSSGPALKLTNADTGGTATDGFDITISGTEVAQLIQRENNAMTFATNNIERMRIKNDGNIGIGSTNPTALFAVGAANQLTVNTSGNLTTSGDIAVNGGDITSSAALNIDSTGNISIRADGDTTDYIYFDTTSNEAALFFENAAQAFANDAGIRINGTTGELEYRDENEGTWTSFDSLGGGSSLFTDAGTVTYLTQTSDDLAIGGSEPDNSAFYFDVSTGNITLEGATADAFETILQLTDPTQDNTITIPNASGEISLLGQTIGSSEIENDVLDFSHFVDAMTVDATTSINLYNGSADVDLRFYNSNSGREYLFFDGSADYIGVGHTTPQNLFHILTSTTDVLDTANGSALIIEQSSTGDAGIQFELTGGQIFSIGIDNSSTNDDFVIFDGNTARLTIDGSSGNLTVAQDLAINGGDLTTSQATFNLLNATATTINFGGGASLIDIGAGTSTVSINDALTIDGNTTLGNATADTVTFNARVASDIDPSADNTYDLGSSSLRWQSLYLGPGSLHISDTTGTSGAGTDYVNFTAGFSGEQLQLTTTREGSQATGGNILMRSAFPAGGGVSEAIRLDTAADLGASDQLLQIGDGGGDLFTIMGNGNVGIGTTNPGNLLHTRISSAGTMDTADGSPLIIEQAGSGDAAIQFELTGGQIFSMGIDNSSTNDDFVIFDGNTARLTINGSSGNVIIAQDLEVNGGDLRSSTSLNIDSTGNISLRADTDINDYLYVDTTSNQAGLFFENAALAYTNDPGIRINGSTGELEYRDEDEGTWTSFDSLLGGGSSEWTDAGTYVYPAEDDILGNPASAGANKITGIYLGDTSPLYFGADNDINYSFSGSTLAVSMGNNDINYDSNTLFIDGSADSVGIGNAAPGNKLHVSANNTSAIDVADGSLLIVEQSGSGDAGIQFELTGGQVFSMGIDNSSTNDDFVLFDGNAARLTVDGSSGNVTVAQGLNVNGNTVLGDNSSDTVTFNAKVASHILPSADDTYDLGSNTDRWRDLYLGPGTLHIGTSTSDEYTISYDTTSNYLGFNVNGSGNPEIVFDANGNIGISTTTPGAKLNVVSTSATAPAFNLNADSLTTGTGVTYSFDALTSGTGVLIESAPGSATTLSGDLFRINIGSNVNVTGSIFTIDNAGSPLFSVSETQITSALPHQFTAPGDVSIAYDIQFTNQTASYIKSKAPLYLEAGESFENNDLTLITYGTGDVVLDLASGNLVIDSADPSIIFDVVTTTDTDFWMGVIDDGGNDDDDIFAIGDGVTKGSNTHFVINTNGNIGMGFTTPGYRLEARDSQASNFVASIHNTNTGASASGLRIQAGPNTNPGTSNDYIKFFDGDGTVLGAIEGNGSGGVTNASSGADFAELFIGDRSKVGAGDILCLDNAGSVTKARQDCITLGAYSTNFNTLGNWVDGWENNNYLIPVALLGQVEIKVRTSNGTIVPGDPISVSSTSGIGEKALSSGRIIGHALEGYINNDPSKSGTIKVLVQPSWFDPINTIDGNGYLAQANQITVDYNNIVEKISTMDIKEWTLGNNGSRHIGPDASSFYAAFGLGENNKRLSSMDVAGVALAGVKNLAERVKVLESGAGSASSTELQDLTIEVENLGNNINTMTNDLDNLKAEVDLINQLLAEEAQETSESSESTMATDPETLLTQIMEMYVEIKDFVAGLGMYTFADEEGNEILAFTNDVQFAGDTTLYNATVTGDLSIGLIDINSLENSININGPNCYDKGTNVIDTALCEAQTLYLQKGLAGNIDMFDGAITFTPDGTISTETLVAGALEIREDGGTIGNEILWYGTDRLTIYTDKVNSSSKVFVTPRGKTSNQTLYVENVVDGFSFDVVVENLANVDIPFDWFIVN